MHSLSQDIYAYHLLYIPSMANRITQKSCHHLQLKFLFSLLCISLVAEYGASQYERKVYIVYMGHITQDESFASSLHISMLNDIVGSDGSKYLLHSYSRSFHGFSAKLTGEEVQKLTRMEGVVSVFPSEKHELHTTRSWDFLGLPLEVKRAANESDVIIGVIDTGIWPESESFSDQGYGPTPSKWKGICQAKAKDKFSCNNKIIGARYYKLDGDFSPNDLQNPRDSNGHGTHTASTAAGNIVPKASLDGLRLGIARGGVPRARIAVYKVCWDDGCSDEDILAAFDDAIADGVDIISVSVGVNFARDYFQDTYAIGSFHALRKGILTSHSANNNGPNPQTTSSVAPWILTVAASTMESKLVTPIKLGNNLAYEGLSINSFKLDHRYPLIYGGDAPNTKAGFNGSSSRLCVENSLNKKLVKGKIALCQGLSDGRSGLLAGASGLLMEDTGPYFDLPISYPLPVAKVNANESASILDYIKLTREPTASLMKSIEIKDALAPYVASFSGRGPNPIANTILKPDLTAPGVAILAAYSPIATVSGVSGDKRLLPYNIISGTSMACPHVSGMAAYIKAFHPTWSPAAIKSALMTTASPMSSAINSDAEFAYGAGHANPTKALDPGLIYDASEDDYVAFLCGEGYTAEQVSSVTGNKNSNCSGSGKGPKDLNYPSFVVTASRNKPLVMKFRKTVTNVGSASSTYKAIFNQSFPSDKFVLDVKPAVLKFKSIGEKKNYEFGIQVHISKLKNSVISASLTWSDGVHHVRSPIVVHVPT